MNSYYARVIGFLSLFIISLYAQSPAPKNVLIFLSDDQGYCELGPYVEFAKPETLGAPRADYFRSIKELSAKKAPVDVCLAAAKKCMPHIDQLAKEGVRFTSFISAPTCAPARTMLMTSRYPQKFGIYCNDDVVSGTIQGVPPEVKMPVKIFKEAGYMTGMVGKWHLGSKLPGQHPNDKGFDYFWGFDMAHTEKYDSKRFMRNKEKEVPAVGWMADQITDEAVGFLKKSATEKKPFFLYVAYNEPHGPTPRPPQKYIDFIKSGSDIVDVYFAKNYGMDCGIGKIIEELKQSGRYDDTIIFFGTDNGAGAPRNSDFGSQQYSVPVPGNGPLRGGKWSAWEGAVRVPFIARIPKGVVKSTNTLASMMDVLPTALEFAQLSTPQDYQLDGKSFLPLLQGKSEQASDEMLFWAGEAADPFPGADWSPEYAKLDETSKQLKKGNFSPFWYARNNKWKVIGWDTIAPALIDIENDPGERKDLAKEHPEVVAQFTKQFKEWLKQQSDPMVYNKDQFQKLKNISVK